MIVNPLCFCWRDVAKWTHEALVVEPCNPRQGGQFDCLDTETGKPRWTKKLKSGTWSSAAVVDDVVVVGDMGGHVYGLDAKTGDEHWVVKIGGRVHSTPVIMNGQIFIGSTDGWFMALGA